MKKSGIIFDMDGVVFDSEIIWEAATKKAADRFGVKLTKAEHQAFYGKTEEQIRSELTVKFPYLNVAEYRDYIIENVDEGLVNCKLKRGFKELIEYLKSNGYKIALATSNYRKRTETMFKNVSLDSGDCFDVTVCRENVTHGKPDPEIFLTACRLLNLDVSECIVLEDSVNGIKAAVNAGIDCIMVEDLIVPNDYCIKNCLFTAKSLDDVYMFLPSYEFETINVDEWNRKSIYWNFSKYDNPIFSIGTRIDVTELVKLSKSTGTKFFINFLYAVSYCTNECDELKIRIKDDNVVKYKTIHPSYIVSSYDDTIVSCRTRFDADYSVFYQNVVPDMEMAKSKEKSNTFNFDDRNDLIYISCLPWMDFTDITNPYNLKDKEISSIPRITWGKYIPEGEKLLMSINISANHALLDGKAVCVWLEKIQKFINEFAQKTAERR